MYAFVLCALRAVCSNGMLTVLRYTSVTMGEPLSVSLVTQR